MKEILRLVGRMLARQGNHGRQEECGEFQAGKEGMEDMEYY